MGMFDFFKGWGKPKKGGDDFSVISVVKGSHFDNLTSEDPIKRSIGNGRVFACVDLISETVACHGWTLFKVSDSGEKSELRSHPFLDLWKKPNPLMSGFDFRKLMQFWLETKGYACALIERGKVTSLPIQLTPLPPDQIIFFPGESKDPKEVDFFVYRSVSGEVRRYSPSDVFVMRKIDPSSPYDRGLNSLQTILQDVLQDEASAKYNLNLHRNGGSPGMIVQADGISRKEAERFKDQWRRDHEGVDNSHRLLILDSQKMKVESIGANSRDMEFSEARKSSGNNIRMHFRLPPELLGQVENSNRATAQVADLVFQKNTIRPRLVQWREAISNFLSKDFGPELDFEFENPVKDSVDQIRQNVFGGLDRGLLTVNEGREFFGLEPHPDGDVLTPQAQYIKGDSTDASSD